MHDPRAGLLVRWRGARKDEVRRLTLDCLDAYPDGYPLLRIPVGKTYTERTIPLLPQAADKSPSSRAGSWPPPLRLALTRNR